MKKQTMTVNVDNVSRREGKGREGRGGNWKGRELEGKKAKRKVKQMQIELAS